MSGTNNPPVGYVTTAVLATALTAYIPLTQKGAANGVVPLNAGSKIDGTYLPSLAISDYLGNFADLTTALANVGVMASQRGDWFTVDTSDGQSYIVTTDSPSTSGDVTLIKTPSSGISLSDISATSPITWNSTTGVISTLMNTNKLIGRSTALSGVMEELTVGTGLSLAAGVLTATGSLSGTGSASRVAYWTGAATLSYADIYLDSVKDAIGIQVADPLVPFHAASTTGTGINNVVTGSATLVAQSLPTAPTCTPTAIGMPSAGSGGSVSFTNGGAGTFLGTANGTVYYFRVYPCLDIGGGIYYKSTNYEALSMGDPNDSQSYDVYVSWGSVTISGETVSYFVEYSTDDVNYYPLGVSSGTSETYVSTSGSDPTSAWGGFYTHSVVSGPDAPTSFDSMSENFGYSGFYESGLYYQYEVDTYKDIGGTKYASGSPVSMANYDNNMSSYFAWDLSWSLTGTYDGVFIRRSTDGGSSWVYTDLGSTSSYTDDSFSDDGVTSGRWGQTYSGGGSTTFSFAPYGKTTAPSGNAVYSAAGTTYSAVISDSNYYIIKHVFTGMPAGGAKILAPQSSPSYGRTVSADFYDLGYTSWGDGTVVTPTSYGFNGTAQNRSYKIYSYDSTLGIYGDTPLTVTTSDEGGYKYVDLDWTLPSGVTRVKITRSINGGAYNAGKIIIGSTITDDDTDASWNDGYVVTPTATIPGTGRFDRANTVLADAPQLAIVDISGSGTRYSKISFGVATSSAATPTYQAHIYSSSNTGYLSFATGRVEISSSLGGTVTTMFGNTNIINNGSSSSVHFQVKGQSDAGLINTRSDYDTVFFGQLAGGDPIATVRIQPNRAGDLALGLAGHSSMSATTVLLRTQTSAGSFGGEITVGGHFWAAQGSTANPGLSFRADPDTGFYNVTTNSMAAVVGGTERTRWTTTGAYFGTSAGVNATARIHIQAGTSSANTAPIKLTSGPLNTSPEPGAEEFLTDRRYYVRTTSSTRMIYMAGTAVPTSSRVWYSDSSGFQIDNANFTYSVNRLSPTYITTAAQTSSAATAPWKMTTGASVMATPEAGAWEYSNPDIHFTPGSAIRYNLPLVTGAGVQGDLIYASAASIYSRLAKNTTATRYLSNTGASNNPAWAQIDLTNGVTGALPVANGGLGGVSLSDGAKIKHARVTTGSIAGATTALITVTWGTAFADTNYTVQASVLDSTSSSLALSVVHIESIAVGSITVRVLNNAVGALTGELHVTAIHD